MASSTPAIERHGPGSSPIGSPATALAFSVAARSRPAAAAKRLEQHSRCANAEIAIVISNKPGARGLELAQSRGIATKAIPSKGLEREAYDRQVVAMLQEHKVELVCLAGYMRLLSPYFVAAYPQRILNIHPALLPSFCASV